MNDSAAPAEAHSASLAPGRVLASRFEIVRTVHEDALGIVVSATDRKTARPLAVRVVSPTLARQPTFVARLREHAKLAATLTHRNIIATFGVGTESKGILFVACEWTDGTELRELVAKRSASGEKLSFRGAYNILAHVCEALTSAADKTHHGTVRPSVIWVTRSGRVKLGDFALGRSVTETAGAAALGPGESAYLAPEVKAGKPGDARSDVFGLGAVFYEMLTGRSASEPFVPPSQANRDVPVAVDSIMLKCLAESPEDRYANAEEVRATLLPFATQAREIASSAEFGIDIDVDVQLSSSRPPPGPAPGADARPAPATPRSGRLAGAGGTPPAPPGKAPRIGARIAAGAEFRVSAPGGPAQPPEAKPVVDLGALLATFTQNDAPRWMVSKGGLDHGPFSGRELVEQILKGEVLGSHELLNLDTGLRHTVEEQPELVDFLEQYKLRRSHEVEAQAVERSKKVEKASNAMKIGLALGVTALLATGLTVYLLTRPDPGATRRSSAELAALYESGNIQITGTAGVLPDTPRRTGGARRPGGSARPGAGGNLSFEDAMDEAVDIGDVSQAGSMQQLSPAQVAGVMNGRINQIYQCVGAELRRGGSLSSVRIQIAILGTGAVRGASVQQGSPSFRDCVAAQVRAIRFPTFSAPRMGAVYSFGVDQ